MRRFDPLEWLLIAATLLAFGALGQAVFLQANAGLVNTLSAAVAWHTEGGEPRGSSQQGAPPRWLPAALVTNIVVVVIAGLVAVALLVIALTQGL